jgi:hypothetical protein
VAKLKLSGQRTNLIGFDAAFESFDAIDGNHRDAIAIALEDRRVAPDVHLVEGEVKIGGEVFQMRSRVVAEVTAGLRIEHDDRFHVRFFQAAYRSDSGLAHSGG